MNLNDFKFLSRHKLRNHQTRLQNEGFPPGPLDGIWGPRTELATLQWLETQGPTEQTENFPEIFRPTTDRSLARNSCEGVIFHHTAGATVQSDTNWILTNPKFVNGRRVHGSYHCLVAPDGSRIQFVPDRQRAYHSGISTFKGRSQCNSFMLGLAFQGDTYKRSLGSKEIDSTLEWLKNRWSVYGWSVDWMTDHRAVAPTRRNDLNPTELKKLIDAIKGEFK